MTTRFIVKLGTTDLLKVDTLEEDDAQGELNYDFPRYKNEHYTVMVYDETVSYLHYLAINISRKDDGEEIISYKPPTPPSGTHRYAFIIYLQNGIIDLESAPKRSQFNLKAFVKKHDLEETDVIPFKVKHTDDPPQDKRGQTKETKQNEREGKYCSCVVKVAAKNTPECNKGKKWPSSGCYNPYAVCAKSTKTSSRGCYKYYQFEDFDDDQLEAFMDLENIKHKAHPKREDMLRDIKQWMNRK